MQPFDSRAEFPLRNVLLATDFTPSSQTALLYALSVAHRSHSRIVMAHVVNPGGQRLFGQDAVQRILRETRLDADRAIGAVSGGGGGAGAFDLKLLGAGKAV